MECEAHCVRFICKDAYDYKKHRICILMENGLFKINITHTFAAGDNL